MQLRGAFDQWLDGRLGGGKTPNLPSRLIGCQKCKKVWNVNRLQKACRHNQELVDETLWNYFRSLLS
jgi:hypothetical protein